MTNDKHVKACVFVDKDVDVSSVLKLLDSRGINAEVFRSPILRYPGMKNRLLTF